MRPLVALHGVALALVFIGRANAGHTARGSEPIVPAVVAASWETVPILHPRLGQAATLLPDGRVLIAGGATPNLLERAQAIYDPLAKRFSPGPSLPSRALSPLAAPVVDGILVAVGFDDNGARIVDVGKGTVRPVGPMSVFHGQGTMVPLLDGTALIFGGGGRESHSVAETYVPETRSFQRVGDLQVKRFRCPAMLLKDGRVLLTGGTSSETATYNRRIADGSRGIIIRRPRCPMGVFSSQEAIAKRTGSPRARKSTIPRAPRSAKSRRCDCRERITPRRFSPTAEF